MEVWKMCAWEDGGAKLVKLHTLGGWGCYGSDTTGLGGRGWYESDTTVLRGWGCYESDTTGLPSIQKKHIID